MTVSAESQERAVDPSNGKPRSISKLAGKLIAIEGIDQAGKQTIAAWLSEELARAGLSVTLHGFPDYKTEIGYEIKQALAGKRDYPPQMRQLLMAANRWEWQADILKHLKCGHAVILDRYIASGLAYGYAQYLDVAWMTSVEQGLRKADLTILLDIDPVLSRERKRHSRDAYEQDDALLVRARAAYLKMATDLTGWLLVDAAAPLDMVKARVLAALGVPV